MSKKSLLSVLNHWVIYLFFIVLYGCHSIHPISDSVDITSLPPRNCSKEMDISGRISVQYTFLDDSDNKFLHGKFHWISENNKTHIDLISPLGQTLATVDIFPDNTILPTPIQASNNKLLLHESNAQAMLSYKLGWDLPISGMQNWLQGCVTDQNGQLYHVNPKEPKITSSDGWNIHYVSWNVSPENQRLPRRIDMIFTPSTSAKTPINQIQIRLIIDKW